MRGIGDATGSRVCLKSLYVNPWSVQGQRRLMFKRNNKVYVYVGAAW